VYLAHPVIDQPQVVIGVQGVGVELHKFFIGLDRLVVGRLSLAEIVSLYLQALPLRQPLCEGHGLPDVFPPLIVKPQVSVARGHGPVRHGKVRIDGDGLFHGGKALPEFMFQMEFSPLDIEF